MKTILNSFLSHKNIGNFGLSNVLTNLEKFFKREGFKVNNINNLNSKIFKNVRTSNIIHIHGCWSIVHLVVFILGKFYKKKIFITPHGMLDPNSMSYKKLKKILAWHFYQKIMIKKADCIIVNSTLEKKNLQKLVRPIKIKVIFHGIHFKKRYLVKKNIKKIKFVYFSRIHPIKCPLELISIWNQSKILSNFKLDLYGEVEDYKYYQKMKPILSSNKNINYCGTLNKKNKFKKLSKYSALIHPSKTENFGMVILESLASGLFIISRNTLPWTVLEKKNIGKLLKIDLKNLEKNIPILAKKIKLLKSKDQFKKIVNFLSEEYDWKKIIKKYQFNYND